MGKIYKAALVLLYLLQLVIVFHEQIMHLFDSAASPIHGSASSHEERHNGLLMRLRQAMEHHRSAEVVLQSERRNEQHHEVAAVHRKEDHAHDAHKEEKNGPKRHKRRPMRQYLISSLHFAIKKIRPSVRPRGDCYGLATARFITFPSNA